MTPESWTAVASVVNAVTVVVLAAITYWYARSANRQAAASELQTAAANAQAKAAQAQARAATEQATAAFQTLATLREQMDDAGQVGKAAVETRIVTTLRRIEEWESPGRLETAANQGALAHNFSLIPADEPYLIESARRVSREFALRLTEAFDHLRSASDIINGMKMADRDRVGAEFYKRESNRAKAFLALAKTALQRCRTDIYTQESDSYRT